MERISKQTTRPKYAPTLPLRRYRNCSQIRLINITSERESARKSPILQFVEPVDTHDTQHVSRHQCRADIRRAFHRILLRDLSVDMGARPKCGYSVRGFVWQWVCDLTKTPCRTLRIIGKHHDLRCCPSDTTRSTQSEIGRVRQRGEIPTEDQIRPCRTRLLAAFVRIRRVPSQRPPQSLRGHLL